MTTLADLSRFKLIYLATPYTHFKLGHHAAYAQACSIACKLIVRGLKVFCPVAHGHPLSYSEGGFLDPADHDLWNGINDPFLGVCDALLIAQMDGWETSKGIAREVDDFLMQGKPIYFLDPSTLGVERTPGLRISRELKESAA